MRIGIYVDVATEKELRGVGYHIVSLVRALSEIDQTNQYLLYYQRPLWSSNGRLLPFPSRANFAARPIRFPEGWKQSHPRFWWQYYLPWVLRRDRIDVFHGPSHFIPPVPFGRTV